jgi:predicted RNA-binding Zn-ribbon protein involved in translation (DUF1610 family)
MSNEPKFKPLKGDLARDELCKAAEEAMDKWGDQLEIHFKFTCPNCGTRCTLQEANKLYESGECHQCGVTAPITHGGFMLMIHVNRKN